MIPFTIPPNLYLRRAVSAFYHTPYVRMGNPGNPDYLNDLKNTFNSFATSKLKLAAQQLQDVLHADLPHIPQTIGLQVVTVCVVPRSKAEVEYHPNQLLFKSTVQEAIRGIESLDDGVEYIRRHTSTKTTHLRNAIKNYNNDGPAPYPGITTQTCYISTNIKGKHILLVDDIYTVGVNIDEDAIQTLLDAGARTVIFYAVGKT